MANCRSDLENVDGVLMGVTSASITVFSAFSGTLLISDDISAVFAATIATWLANGISDAFSVGTSNKNGIDLTRDGGVMRGIALSEFVYAGPIVAFSGILSLSKRKFTFKNKVLIALGVLLYEIAALFFSVQFVAKEELNSTGVRLLIVVSIISIISVITYLLTKLSRDKKI